MTITPTSPPRDRSRADFVTKALRYASVSLVGVVSTQVLIFFFHALLDFAAVPSNVVSVMIASLPAYLLNRYWVWGKRGKNHLTREVLPFWGFALVGLILSTVFVAMVERRTDATLAISAANISGFGVLWVARFFVLDRLLFKEAAEENVLVKLAEDAPLA